MANNLKTDRNISLFKVSRTLNISSLVGRKTLWIAFRVFLLEGRLFAKYLKIDFANHPQKVVLWSLLNTAACSGPTSALDDLHFPHCWEHQAPSSGVLPTQSYCCATKGQSHEGATGMAVQFPSRAPLLHNRAFFCWSVCNACHGFGPPTHPVQSHFLPTAYPSLAPSWSFTHPHVLCDSCCADPTSTLKVMSTSPQVTI